MYLLGGAITRVHLRRLLHRGEDVVYQLVVTRVVGRYHLAAEVSLENIVHNSIVLLICLSDLFFTVYYHNSFVYRLSESALQSVGSR